MSNLYSNDHFIGQVLQGNYKLEKQVGVGGMAWVFRALHTKLQETMAVKILLPHISSEEEIRVRFINEAKIQFKLKHPNIVQVTDIIEDSGVIGIVMEWVNGENLKQFLKRVGIPLPLRDVWWLMAPVFDAVGYAHKKGLVHRDLKPPNIMLHQEEKHLVPKVADFGIAKLLDEAGESNTKTGMVMGTIKYMSPEQMHDSKNVDPRSDIYSLGVMLYLMATGQLPFSGANEMVIYKTLQELPPPPSTVNPKLPNTFDKLIEKALAKDPNDRYASCAELSHALSLALLSSSGQIDDDDETKALSPIEVQKMLMEMPDTEPSNIYVSSIYPGPIGHGQIAPSINALIDEQGDSQRPHHPEHPVPSPRQISPDEIDDLTSAATVYQTTSTERKNPLIVFIIIFFILAGGGATAYFALTSRQSAVVPPVQRRTDNNPPPTRNTQTPTNTCSPGEQRACSPHPSACTRNASGTYTCKGVCKPGIQHCVKGTFGPCKGGVAPQAKELCNGKDDDCNGKIDEIFVKKNKACRALVGDCGFPGVYTCSKDHTKLFCKRQGKSTSKAPQIRIKIRPGNKKVTIRYLKKTRRFRSQYCIETKRARFTIRVRGYYTCVVRLRARSKPYFLKMQRESDGLEPQSSYCR